MRRSPLLITELEEAIRLLRRPQGATTKQLERPLRVAHFDAAWKLRSYLKRYKPNLKLVATRMTAAERSKYGYYGSSFIYRVEDV